MSKYEVVFCVVNEGFSEAVMQSARAAGARGGTVIHASGTANPKAERFFGVSIQPEKEMLLILVDSTIKEKVLHNLYRDVGLNTAGQGIAFTLPVTDVVGLTPIGDKSHKEGAHAHKDGAHAHKDGEHAHKDGEHTHKEGHHSHNEAHLTHEEIKPTPAEIKQPNEEIKQPQDKEKQAEKSDDDKAE